MEKPIVDALAPKDLGRPMHILLIEDNLGDILLMNEAFRAAKLAVSINVARDGEEGLNMLRRQPIPDLILLDLNLPKKSGCEVLDAIKADPALMHIPVVVLTGSEMHTDIIKGYGLKAHSYIVKPLDFASVREIVASIECFWFSLAVLPGHRKEPVNGD